MKLKTEAEIFETAAKHLLKQNKQAKGITGVVSWSICLYRGEDGLKCAVGCLIPDKFYTEDIEGKPIKGMSVKLSEVLSKSGIPEEESTHSLLALLQDCHDNHEPEEWPELLTGIHSRHFDVDGEVSSEYVNSLKPTEAASQ